MAGRYGFTGGGAQNAIAEFLLQRELQERQRLHDALMQQKQAADLAREGEDLTLRKAAGARAGEDLALRQKEFDATEADRTQQRRTQAAGIRVGQMLPGRELQPADVAAITGTPYETRMESQQTLPSRTIPAEGQATLSDAGGRAYSTLAPTADQMKSQGQQSAREEVAQVLAAQGDPRSKVVGLLARAGENINGALLNDPKDPAQQHGFRMEEIAAQGKNALAAAGAHGAADQQRLEQQYRTLLTRPMSQRSGGLGLEDQKVNQALHLLAVFDLYRDPKTGAYAIPRVQQNELALGLARLISPNGQVGIELEREVNQRTAKGDIAGLVTYLTGQPVTGNTQAIFDMLRDSIQRQGSVAEQNRDTYLEAIRNMAPTDLAPQRAQALERGLNLNSLTRRAGAGGGKKTAADYLKEAGHAGQP